MLNLTGFFSGREVVPVIADIVGRFTYFGALTKGRGCFVAKKEKEREKRLLVEKLRFG